MSIQEKLKKAEMSFTKSIAKIGQLTSLRNEILEDKENIDSISSFLEAGKKSKINEWNLRVNLKDSTLHDALEMPIHKESIKKYLQEERSVLYNRVRILESELEQMLEGIVLDKKG